ncbi:MAG: DUF4445 domain-containing protein [Blautia sp.]|nr:DUF4445 domain-containing protein [Blautia sp.]
MVKVEFVFEDGKLLEAYANSGDSLLEVAGEHNVAMDAPCSGNASCGKCRVRLLRGELDSRKTIHISEEEYRAGWRLACTSRLCGDVSLLIPDISFSYINSMKTADLNSPEEILIFDNARRNLQMSGLEPKNGMDIIALDLAEPSLEDTMPDNERLIRGLRGYFNINRVRLPYNVLRKLPEVLRKNRFKVKCVVWTTSENMYVYDIYGIHEKVVIGGLAVDVGTTTVSALLFDMETGEILAKMSAGNAQIRYGADVINRIIRQQEPNGITKLQDAIIGETLCPMIEEMCLEAGISKEQIYRICIAGNTTMNHLLLGVHAEAIRTEPYIPAFFRTETLLASDIGIPINKNARLIMAPNIGSYVGGDITAGTLVSMLWNRPEFSLFVDLGTNGEIVFGNNEFMMSCACSAGPAFEGGDISCGMRACDGAIEACRIDRNTMAPDYSVIGEPGTRPVGLCGSGIIDVISELFMAGIIDQRGKFVREGARIRRDSYGIGSYVLAFEEEAGSVKDVEITEVDIDNFIRAKGAIYSAICTMLSSLGFETDMIEDVYVAGGIGRGINIRNAINIGMLPDLPLKRFHYVGNTSLTGAYLMLLSSPAEQKTYELAENMTYVELSVVPDYMDEFVGACFMPHTDAGRFPSVKRR